MGEPPPLPLDSPLGVYVHWPYCARICPYCDFNVVRDRGRTDEQSALADAIVADLEAQRLLTGERQLLSIFFGGGTPSLMEPATVAAVIEQARAVWQADPDTEITLEANPTSVEAGKFAAFRSAGVNRVSLGVQSLREADLKFLGRQHSAGEARQAIELARHYFDRFTFDLIYARPGQTVAAWREELREALALAGNHLSVYQLTIEPETAFASAVRRGELTVPDEDRAAELYETTQEALAEAGLPAYEISNHARPGEESRHNLTYWRYGDYAGIGPGAHGRLTLEGVKYATRQHRAPEAWLEMVEQKGHATRQRDLVDAEARREEMLMMGLRLAEGVDAARFAAETGGTLLSALDAPRLKAMIDGGFVTSDDQGLRATAAGRQRLNAVLAQLLA